MSSFSKYATKQTAAGAVAVSFVIYYLAKKRNALKSGPVRRLDVPEVKYVIGEKTTHKVKAHVDAAFFKQLKFLLSIGVPGLFSKESGFMFLIAISLAARTLCDLWMINNATSIENAIVTMNKPKFHGYLLKFLLAMPSIALVNNVLKWSLGELKLNLRTRLTHYLYNEYLKGFTYYQMTNVDNRIANADQLLTADVDKFCDMVTDLYSNMCKPLLDIVIYVYRLTTNLGGQTPALMIAYLMFGGSLLTYFRRPAGRMTVMEQKLEGEYRYINSRLIAHSEEVAFFGGNNREKFIILASFHRLMNHLRKFLKFKVLMGVLDNVLGKYFATVVGFYAVSMPFMKHDHSVLGGKSNERRFMEYYNMGRMMVKLAESIGRMVLALRDLNRLAGLTARVNELTSVLADINAGSLKQKQITGSSARPVGAGQIKYQDKIIKFENVPLMTPNGDILVDEPLNFEVKSGMNVIICGPNGCGKSSLFRILGELWPIQGGVLIKPPKTKLFYVPQKPYMTLGTLRDQVIYPHTKEEMMRRRKSDAQLTEFLERVNLKGLIERYEDGWDAIDDWIGVLSGGEKQRVAMARLFYHEPQFAILDECTSAVSAEIEDSLYQYCREKGITLFTVSHRKYLVKHHEFELRMDGRGACTFRKLDPEDYIAAV